MTSRCVAGEDDEMKIKMIEVSKNLPFDTDSHIVHVSTDIELKGDLPVLDGAAALFPLYSSFTEAIYPEESVLYNRETDEFEENSALQFRNAVRGFDALINGDADVFFSAYPSEEQMEHAAQMGAEIEFVPIGKEAFVFLVNADIRPFSAASSRRSKIML